MILVAALLEEFSFRAPGLKPLVSLAVIAGGGLVALFSWKRYRSIMGEAERLGDRSTCGACGAYARFDVVESGGSSAAAPDDEPPATWLRVRCRKCGHGWTMP
jgi:ribosomal protein S27AE